MLSQSPQPGQDGPAEEPSSEGVDQAQNPTNDPGPANNGQPPAPNPPAPITPVQPNESIEDLVADSESVTDIDTYERLQRVAMERYKLTTLITTWKEEQKAERDLRTTYGKWLLWILTGEIVFAGVVLLILGFGGMSLPEWQVNTFFVAIFAKITGMVWLVLKYLFPASGDNIHKLIEKL